MIKLYVYKLYSHQDVTKRIVADVCAFVRAGIYICVRACVCAHVYYYYICVIISDLDVCITC